MNYKFISASIIVFVFLLFGAYSFIKSNVEYTDFQTASETGRTVQIEGVWLREQENVYDAVRNEFVFHMEDTKGGRARVVLEGPQPNNFEIATSIVVKGRFVSEDEFRSTHVLTKCPSRYEGSSEDISGHPDNQKE